MKLIKTKIMLLTLSIFYDIVFIDKLWTNPKFHRAYIGLLGIIISGITGILYFIGNYFYHNENLFPYDLLLIIGILMFIFGGFGKRLIFSFDVSDAINYIKSLKTLLCFTSNIQQSSAIIEIITSYIGSKGLNSLKSPNSMLQFAYDIWIESLMDRGFHPKVFTMKSKFFTKEFKNK
ncbi:MAG: hypothetical protein QXW27_00520 [Candidatus Methanomethylicaceae archaeon]